jgi:hypothetical protein
MTTFTIVAALAAIALIAAAPARADLFGSPNPQFAAVGLQSHKVATRRAVKSKAEDTQLASNEVEPAPVALGPVSIIVPHIGLAVAP